LWKKLGKWKCIKGKSSIGIDANIYSWLHDVWVMRLDFVLVWIWIVGT
jgi:hypothetical protein